MQWKGDCLCLTEDGAQVVEDILLKAEPALWY